LLSWCKGNHKWGNGKTIHQKKTKTAIPATLAGLMAVFLENVRKQRYNFPVCSVGVF